MSSIRRIQPKRFSARAAVAPSRPGYRSGGYCTDPGAGRTSNQAASRVGAAVWYRFEGQAAATSVQAGIALIQVAGYCPPRPGRAGAQPAPLEFCVPPRLQQARAWRNTGPRTSQPEGSSVSAPRASRVIAKLRNRRRSPPASQTSDQPPPGCGAEVSLCPGASRPEGISSSPCGRRKRRVHPAPLIPIGALMLKLAPTVR